MQIRLAESDEEILACFPVMSQLRPHLLREEFTHRVRDQQQRGYKLAMLIEDDEVSAVAGFRIGQSLAWDRFLYVDDLVTSAGVRSKGNGQQLFDWLLQYAREHDCSQLHLDSGVQRFDAHRFYLRNRMKISSHHFGLDLST